MSTGLDPYAAVPTAEAEQFPYERVVPVSTGTISSGKALLPMRGKLTGFAVADAGVGESLAGTPVTNVPAAGASAVVTIAAIPGQRIKLRSLAVSLSATIAATSHVTITDGGVTVLDLVLPQAAGLYTIPLGGNGLEGAVNSQMVITATTPGAAGVASISGVYDTTSTAASFDLYDGQDATGQYLGTFVLPLGGSVLYHLGQNGPTIQTGVYVNPTAGSIKGSFWVRSEPT